MLGLLAGMAVAESLDRASIAASIKAIKPQVLKCGEAVKVKGVVKIVVLVNPDGTVAETKVKETPDVQLGACVAAAVRKATFGTSKNGGSFAYPFRF
jgi:outer membrane biosynthesis protein TonB